MMNDKLSNTVPTCDEFQTDVVRREEKLLKSLRFEGSICDLLKEGRLARFAEAFYFIRVHFVKLNFIAGARCPTHELFWGGLAHNLMEELGGGAGPSHNELYRWFLQDVGIEDEEALKCPDFAHHFDEQWENFARSAPLEQVLAAIAVYEIFDNPDYAMLLRVMSAARVSERGLIFFRVHAGAAHFELFEDYFRHVSVQHTGLTTLQIATDFVLRQQDEMWSGLLAHLQN